MSNDNPDWTQAMAGVVEITAGTVNVENVAGGTLAVSTAGLELAAGVTLTTAGLVYDLTAFPAIYHSMTVLLENPTGTSPEVDIVIRDSASNIIYPPVSVTNFTGKPMVIIPLTPLQDTAMDQVIDISLAGGSSPTVKMTIVLDQETRTPTELIGSIPTESVALLAVNSVGKTLPVLSDNFGALLSGPLEKVVRSATTTTNIVNAPGIGTSWRLFNAKVVNAAVGASIVAIFNGISTPIAFAASGNDEINFGDGGLPVDDDTAISFVLASGGSGTGFIVITEENTL